MKSIVIFYHTLFEAPMVATTHLALKWNIYGIGKHHIVRSFEKYCPLYRTRKLLCPCVDMFFKPLNDRQQPRRGII